MGLKEPLAAWQYWLITTCSFLLYGTRETRDTVPGLLIYPDLQFVYEIFWGGYSNLHCLNHI